MTILLLSFITPKQQYNTHNKIHNIGFEDTVKSYVFIYLFIYLFIKTQQKDQEASNTVGKSTKSKKHMWHAINETQANEKKRKWNQVY